MMKRYFFYLLILSFAVSGCQKNAQKPCCEEIPLYVQVGADPKMYSTLTVTPETQDMMSDEFRSRWETAKIEIEKLEGGPRRLRSFEIKFISENQLTVTYSYNTAAGALATAVITYNCTYDNRGYMRFNFAGWNANGRLISPALFAFQDAFLERYAFRIDWIENKIPGSKGKIAAYYKDGESSAYIYGTLSK